MCCDPWIYLRPPSQADLEHTIGESAALGAAGVVLWGDMSYSRSAVSTAACCPATGWDRLRKQLGSGASSGEEGRLRGPQAAPQGWSSRQPPLLLQESCASLRRYLVSTLGPYVANVTAAARACSLQQCHGHGRCVRRQPRDLGSLLHLATSPWLPFRCHCYRGWAGQDCAQREWPDPAACLAPTRAHSLYGHREGLQPPDTCLPRGAWGW